MQAQPYTMPAESRQRAALHAGPTARGQVFQPQPTVACLTSNTLDSLTDATVCCRPQPFFKSIYAVLTSDRARTCVFTDLWFVCRIACESRHQVHYANRGHVCTSGLRESQRLLIPEWIEGLLISLRVLRCTERHHYFPGPCHRSDFQLAVVSLTSKNYYK